MTTRKERHRQRRRVERTMDEAWEALASGDHQLAQKLSQRAQQAGPMNPRIQVDHGRIMHRCGDLDEAERAFRSAIALAPAYADAFAALAGFQHERGKLRQAVRLQARAVELAPTDDHLRQTLAGYRAEIDEAPARGATAEAPAGEYAGGHTAASPAPSTERTAHYDWPAFAAELTQRGAVALPDLIDGAECAHLRDLLPRRELFEWESVDPDGGGELCRYLGAPLPELVDSLRAELYGRAAAIANHWQDRLDRADRWPPVAESFLERRREHELRSDVALVQLPAAGFRTPRSERPYLAFPLRAWIALGPAPVALELADDRPGKRLKGVSLTLAPGDGALCCTLERPVTIAGVLGLQRILCGIAAADAERLLLDLPFGGPE